MAALCVIMDVCMIVGGASSDAVSFAGWLTVFMIAIIGIGSVSQYVQIKRLTQEHDELARNCFD